MIRKDWLDRTYQAKGSEPCSQFVCPDCGKEGREFHTDWAGRPDRPAYQENVCWYDCSFCGQGLFYVRWEGGRPVEVGRRG